MIAWVVPGHAQAHEGRVAMLSPREVNAKRAWDGIFRPVRPLKIMRQRGFRPVRLAG